MNSSIIVSSTPDLKKSLDFYEKLGFTMFENHGKHFAVDGKYVIEVSDQKYIRSGVKIYKESWNTEVEALKKITAVEKVEGGYVFADATGIWLQLQEGSNPNQLEIEISKKSRLGTIAGLSLEGISIPHMFKTWKLLGFEKTMGDEQGGWMVAQNDDGFGVSLMKLNACPHAFYNPSLTYFNGKENLQIISNIRAAGIEITEEITVFNDEGIVDNVILRDPGGFGFFIFSD